VAGYSLSAMGIFFSAVTRPDTVMLEELQEQDEHTEVV
jgi:hypothetical protein